MKFRALDKKPFALFLIDFAANAAVSSEFLADGRWDRMSPNLFHGQVNAWRARC